MNKNVKISLIILGSAVVLFTAYKMLKGAPKPKTPNEGTQKGEDFKQLIDKIDKAANE